jgi:hypothetical protein
MNAANRAVAERFDRSKAISDARNAKAAADMAAARQQRETQSKLDAQQKQIDALKKQIQK